MMASDTISPRDAFAKVRRYHDLSGSAKREIAAKMKRFLFGEWTGFRAGGSTWVAYGR
jgi:hypothetical protein